MVSLQKAANLLNSKDGRAGLATAAPQMCPTSSYLFKDDQKSRTWQKETLDAFYGTVPNGSFHMSVCEHVNGDFGYFVQKYYLSALLSLNI